VGVIDTKRVLAETHVLLSSERSCEMARWIERAAAVLDSDYEQHGPTCRTYQRDDGQIVANVWPACTCGLAEREATVAELLAEVGR
jgi:hypothetical protein